MDHYVAPQRLVFEVTLLNEWIQLFKFRSHPTLSDLSGLDSHFWHSACQGILPAHTHLRVTQLEVGRVSQRNSISVVRTERLLESQGGCFGSLVGLIEQRNNHVVARVDEGQHGRGDMGAGGVTRCQRTLEILFPSHGMVCSLYSTALSLTDVPSGCSKAVVILGQVSSDHRG
ncbi:unnamed protein product [Gadus morhua 'NCC']